MKYNDYSNIPPNHIFMLSFSCKVCLGSVSVVMPLHYHLLGAWVWRVLDVGFSSCVAPAYYQSPSILYKRLRVEVHGPVSATVCWSAVLKSEVGVPDKR